MGNFWKQKIIKLPQDIFNLNYSKIENMEGWGKQSVTNLKYSINLRKNISFERFIYALGIRHIGFENAKLISKSLKSAKNLLDLTKADKFEELINLDGMGETQIKSIESFFLNTKNIEVVRTLINSLKIVDFKVLNKKGKFSNKNLMFTGGFIKISRSEAKILAEDNGGKVLGTISKKLDILIVGESKPTKKKIDKAKELNIKIINEKDWYKLLNI